MRCESTKMAAANSFIDDGKQAKSDVVKRGLLKFKASKVKGTVGASARGVSYINIVHVNL